MYLSSLGRRSRAGTEMRTLVQDGGQRESNTHRPHFRPCCETVLAVSSCSFIRNIVPTRRTHRTFLFVCCHLSPVRCANAARAGPSSHTGARAQSTNHIRPPTHSRLHGPTQQRRRPGPYLLEDQILVGNRIVSLITVFCFHDGPALVPY